MEKDVVNYFKHRAVCKICYKKNRRKNNNKISHHNQKSKQSITKTMTIDPRTSSDEVIELLQLIKSRIRKTPRKWNLDA